MAQTFFSKIQKNNVQVEVCIDDQKRQINELQMQINAIDKTQAVIHFSLDGTILDANQNFLRALGYTLDEIKGKHHRIFVESSYAQGHEYAEFWAKMRRGEFDQGEYKRIGKGGKEVWILASYNPILDADGKPVKVIKFATDVTETKLRNAEFEDKLAAIGRVQGVIEFDLDGKILDANQNFLSLMGYRLDEVKGRPHSIFVEPGFERSEDYAQFWANLREGRADARVYKRFGKNGRHVWIQASYNPIRDLNGKPYKVVKFASDITNLIDQTESTKQTASSVAAATEEMSVSISEISQNMDLSRRAAEEITTVTVESGQEAARLTDSMKSMDNIVGMIRNIAGQVNLLALNATIEAARAGTAGKGFAVVASEIKSLSVQTAEATKEISREIGEVTSISGKVAESIRQTMDGVGRVGQYISGVATAMDEQIAVTKDIAQHTSHMVSAVDQILQQTRAAGK